MTVPAVWDPATVFRLNPEYALLDRTRLDTTARDQCRALLTDPEFFGLLVPAHAGRHAIKAIQCGDAALLRTLERPGCVPAEWAAAHPAIDGYLSQLVEDGVLEFATPRGFVSGPGAARYFVEPTVLPARSISEQAMAHVYRLRLTEPSDIARRLYAYNRFPTANASRTAQADRVNVMRSLGLKGRDVTGFRELHSTDDRRPWIDWVPAQTGPAAPSTCKLYICVRPEDLPAVFLQCASVAARHGAVGFKVGADRPTLNRPDKCILYFASTPSLRACADDLTAILAGFEPHALPFAGPLGSPALAWGADPPATEPDAMSWRMWVCRHVAVALHRAAVEGLCAADALALAGRHVARVGVDPGTWGPDRVHSA